MLDFVEHLTRNVSMTLIAASAASMLRSTIVIFAALLSVFYLKNKLYRHHITSLVIITVGAVLVGVALVIKGDEKSKSLFVGIVLLLLGQAFGSMSYTVEEKIMMIYPELDPCVLIGYEGLWMSIVWACVLPAFQHIPCSNKELCHDFVVEDTLHAF